MATPLFVLGWENGLWEADAFDGGDDFPVVSNTRATFGGYSLRHAGGLNTSTIGAGRVVDSLTEMQVSFSLNHDGVSVSAGTLRSNLIHFICEDGRDFRVCIGNDGNLTLRDNTTALATLAFSGSGLSATNTWFAVSCAIKIHSSTGYFVFYGASGEELLSFSGNTGSSPIVAVLFGGHDINSSAAAFNNFSYYTDCILYDNSGGGSAPAPARRLLWAQAAGNGQSSEWEGSDGNSTDNYLLVDDGVTVDEDATFVKALEDGLQDQYTHEGITIPADWVAREVWPTVIAKKTDVVDISLLLGLWKDSLLQDSDPLELATSYGMVQARFTALPDASDLIEANIDALEIRVVSAGTFS